MKADKTKVYRFWVDPVMITKGNGKFHYFVKRSDYLKAQRKIAKLEAELAKLKATKKAPSVDFGNAVAYYNK